MAKDCDDTLLIPNTDVPEYDKPTIPQDADLYITVEEQNFDYGGVIQATYRLPLSRVIPNNTYQGLTYSLNSPGANISVPADEVVPAYVEAFDPFELKRAQAVAPGTSLAQFVIISPDQNVDDSYVVQASGFYRFPTVHTYLVGQQYYLSDSTPGGVTNVPPVGIKQRIFIPIDQSTILFNIDEE